MSTPEPSGPDVPQLPLLEAAAVDAAAETKPTWRGWIHAGTFPVALVAGVVLIIVSQGAAAKWASAVFMLTSLLLFGNSALYHRVDWRPKVKVLLKRIDHANILLLIAGTYTPLAVLALPPEKGVLLLSLVWGGTLVGILFRVFWIHAPRWLYVALYLLLGWAAVMYLADLMNANFAMMVLVIVGGLLYTGARSSTRSRSRTPGPGTSGSTRSSTCARCSRSSATGPHACSSPCRRCRPRWARRDARSASVRIAVGVRGSGAVRGRRTLSGSRGGIALGPRRFLGVELVAHLFAVPDTADAAVHVPDQQDHRDHDHDDRGETDEPRVTDTGSTVMLGVGIGVSDRENMNRPFVRRSHNLVTPA